MVQDLGRRSRSGIPASNVIGHRNMQNMQNMYNIHNMPNLNKMHSKKNMPNMYLMQNMQDMSYETFFVSKFFNLDLCRFFEAVLATKASLS